MAVTKEFTTAVRRAKPIEFALDGVLVKFTPPKQGPLLFEALAGQGTDIEQTRLQFDWLSAGLSEDQNDWLVGRLKDPDDDFDVADLNQVVEWLQEQITGRPTG